MIKKKENGIYSTLAYASLFSPEEDGNAIPENEWLTLTMHTENTASNTVHIAVVFSKDGSESRIEALDTPREGSPLFERSHNGIRSDFFDAEFSDYSVEELLPL